VFLVIGPCFNREKTMQTVPTPGSGKTALLFGAIFGICAGLVQTLLLFLLSGAGYLLSLLLWIVALVLAGLFASKRTGKVSTGTLAGLWSGLFGGVIVMGIFALLLLVVTHNPALMDEMMNEARSNGMPSSITAQQAIVDVGLGMIILAAAWLLFSIGAGAGIGAIGGAIGKGMSPATQYVQQPYVAYPPAQSFPPYVPPATPMSAPPGPLPYPINRAPVPPASQPRSDDAPYPPPPSYYQQPKEQSESAEVSNPYADSQQPPYLSQDQQQ
jgi:hypothetical protein